MVKLIEITQDKQVDKIALYRDGLSFLMIAERSDLNTLKQTREARFPGLYILMGKDKRYVGQTTTIAQRLTTHNSQVEWWTQVLFFGHYYGELDRAQLDYLEAKLIAEFQDTSFVLENATQGNSSWIDPHKQIQAEHIWETVQSILQDVANINLFDKLNTIEPDTSQMMATCSILLSNGQSIVGKNPTQNYINFFQTLLHDPNYQPLIEPLIVDTIPNSRTLLGRKERIDTTSGNRVTRQLAPGLHLLTNLSTADKKRVLLRFADKIGLDITINWD